jgi:hypothetical protein
MLEKRKEKKETVEDFLTPQELTDIKNLIQDLNTAKIKLADGFLELESVKKVLQIIKDKLIDNERSLVAKYGADAKLSLETGRITRQKADKAKDFIDKRVLKKEEKPKEKK